MLLHPHLDPAFLLLRYGGQEQGTRHQAENTFEKTLPKAAGMATLRRSSLQCSQLHGFPDNPALRLPQASPQCCTPTSNQSEHRLGANITDGKAPSCRPPNGGQRCRKAFGTCKDLKGQAETKRFPLSQIICDLRQGLRPCKSSGISASAQLLCSRVNNPAEHVALKRK